MLEAGTMIDEIINTIVDSGFPASWLTAMAKIKKNKRIKNGMADFNIYAVDSNGGVSDYHRFSLPTQKRVK
jgi:hypothetical protein